MKLSKISQVDAFLAAVHKCSGTVYLESPYGDRFNLNSGLCQYIAVAQLVGEHGDELELFCETRGDEQYFFDLFRKYPEIL